MLLASIASSCFVENSFFRRSSYPISHQPRKEHEIRCHSVRKRRSDFVESAFLPALVVSELSFKYIPSHSYWLPKVHTFVISKDRGREREKKLPGNKRNSGANALPPKPKEGFGFRLKTRKLWRKSLFFLFAVLFLEGLIHNFFVFLSSWLESRRLVNNLGDL